MDPSKLQSWAEQRAELKARLDLRPLDTGEVRLVAGLDISFYADDTHGVAVIAIVDWETRELVWSKANRVRLDAPYMPGFLAFREVPHFLRLVEEADDAGWRADVYMVDGNGILHPDGFGSACHLGVSIGRPTIGVAKKLFNLNGVNEANGEKICESGEIANAAGEVVGAALTHNTRPVYVSPGNLIDLRSAMKITQRMLLHRVPEPVRQADIIGREKVRRDEKYS